MKWLWLVFAIAPLFADNYPRQPGIDVQHYVFRIGLTDANDRIDGETTVTVRFVKDGVNEFALDLGQAMTVAEVTGARFTHEHDRLQLTLPAAPANGELRQFTIRYSGAPAAGLKFLKNKYGERCIFSTNWPDLARNWLPTIDHPYDKATGEFIVTAPSQYQVVANGRLEEEIALGEGRRLTHWNQHVPIAAWLYNIGVAQFASRHFDTVAGVPLETWVYHQDRDAGIGTFEEPTRQAID